MKKIKHILSTTLAVSLILPSVLVSGCGSSKEEVVISEDDPWYDTSMITIGQEYSNDPDIDYYNIQVLAAEGDSYITRVDGYYTIPEDFDYMNDDYNAYHINCIKEYNSSGEVIRTIELDEAIEDVDIDCDEMYIQEASYSDGMLNMNINAFTLSGSDYRDEYYKVVFDIESEEIVSVELQANDENAEESSNEGTVDVGGGYSITKLFLWGDDNGHASYILSVTDPEGNVENIDLREAFPDMTIWNIDSLIPLGDNKVLVVPSLVEERQYFEIDLNAMTIGICEEDLSWLDGTDLYNVSIVDGIGACLFNEFGIKKLNFESKSIDTILSFSDTYMSSRIASSLNLLSYSEGTYVFSGSVQSDLTGMNYSSDTVIVTLSRAQTNPNAGKTVLTAASMNGNISTAVAEAICDFNMNNPDFFVRITDEYKISDYVDYSETDENTDWTLLELNAQSELSSKLAIDLMAGDGPDIILNGLDYSMLNNDDYLLDLSDRFSGDGFFGNAVDSARVGNKLYQIPLAFGIRGISTSADNVDPGQVGFTFDQYTEFVSDVCNGSNPITEGRLDAFYSIISAMNGDFVNEDGEYSFDNDSFRAIAEYVNENIPEEYDWGDDEIIYDSAFGSNLNDTTVTVIWGFSNFLNSYGARINDLAFLGYPSVDGRGATFYGDHSVAVSAETVSEDGCWAFIEKLLSADIQRYYFNEDIPLSIEAFESLCSDSIDAYNAMVDQYSQWMSEAEMREYGYEYVDESVVDRFIEIVNNASGFSNCTDAAVQVILREEIQAYFSGQKSIDQVIDIIQDKVNTYVRERG